MIPLGENEKLHSIHVVRFADGSGFKLISKVDARGTITSELACGHWNGSTLVPRWRARAVVSEKSWKRYLETLRNFLERLKATTGQDCTVDEIDLTGFNTVEEQIEFLQKNNLVAVRFVTPDGQKIG